MPLTPGEKVAGRDFRDDEIRMLRGLNTLDPPDLTVMSAWANVRHDCDGRSIALELKERYDYSPSDGDVPAGRFGWIWKEGRCSACGRTARSGDGRFVIADERPPRERSSRAGRAQGHGGDSRFTGTGHRQRKDA
jgi:hypothetical protein